MPLKIIQSKLNKKDLSLLSVCCAVIYHTLIHAPHSLEEIRKHTLKKYRNTDKYKKTKCSPGIARRSTSASRPWSRLGLATLPPTPTRRSFTPSSWCSLAVSCAIPHVLTPELIFWSPPAIWSTHPPVNSHLMLWAGSRIFEVLEFTYYMANPRTHPVIVTPTGFHCCYSLLLTTTQFNISYATPWKSSGQYCNDIWQNFWPKCWFPSMTSLQNWTSWVRFSGNSRKALGHQWRWKPSYFLTIENEMYEEYKNLLCKLFSSTVLTVHHKHLILKWRQYNKERPWKLNFLSLEIPQEKHFQLLWILDNAPIPGFPRFDHSENYFRWNYENKCFRWINAKRPTLTPNINLTNLKICKYAQKRLFTATN